MRGGISSPNNPVLANIFFRLHIIEFLGTGIRRINDLYEKYTVKPKFAVMDNYLRITLPLAESRRELTAAETKVKAGKNIAKMAKKYLTNDNL